MAASGSKSDAKGGTEGTGRTAPQMLVASAILEPSQMQDLVDILPKLLEVKNKFNAPISFHVRIEMGDGKALPATEAVKKVNGLLKEINDRMQLG